MFERFLFLFTVVLICSGCTTLPEKEEQSQPPSSVQSSQPAIKTPRKISFAPTYVSTEADTYFDAVEIYDSSPKASQGVYHCQGLVYVIVCIDTNKEKIKYLEGTAMLRTVALLRKYYPELPPKFNIRNRVVEKLLDDETGRYRYATVYREKDIKRKLKK